MEGPFLSPRPIGARVRAGVVAVIAATGLLFAGLPASQAVARELPELDVATATAAGDTAADDSLPAGDYIVVLRQQPEATYDGRTAGLPATRPAEGGKFSAASAAAGKYREHLRATLRKVRERADVEAVTNEFTTVTSGFSAHLSAQQAQRLAKDPEILAVAPDRLRQLDTSKTPDFLGLTGDDGLWGRLGGIGAAGAGSSVVVGVLDSGIWPESPSFAAYDPSEGARAQVAARLGFTGACDAGPDARGFVCNDKLIGARYYVEGFGADRLGPNDFLSPRDGHGHGSHTASTAAGRSGVSGVSGGRDFGDMSGIAPGARIASYKVCWEGNPGTSATGCFDSDAVAAINDAVADGVDVINFSISGTTANYTDPVEIAFLNAAVAGVFVAASAGNSGPGESTVDHPSPWLTTVAASTHTVNESTVELGDGERLIGASLTTGLDQLTPMVLSDDIMAPGATTEQAQLCLPDSLDPTGAQGKIVVCDRGENPRVEKSRVVADAGGVGMIMVNPAPNSLNADNHVIPAVHLPDTARDAVRKYAAKDGAKARILAGVAKGSKTKVPEVVSFSSRGPSLGGDGDILKPDISAPGVDVIAAVAPPSNFGRINDFMSGTSMSAPHIAGLAALIKDSNPGWGPMDIKSAMMTTAYDHATADDAFAQGAGFVDPREFTSPGLVYRAGLQDWADFLLGQGVDIGIPGAKPIDASDLNQPSISLGGFVGSQTVERRVTNTGASSAVFSSSVSGLSGINVKVTPARLALAPGATGTFKVRFAYRTASVGDYAQGHLTWKSHDDSVRIPVVARPLAIGAPDEVTGAAEATSVRFDVTPGTTAAVKLSLNGLAAGVENASTVAVGPAALVPNEANKRYDVTVPDGVSLARFDLDAASQNADLDLDVVGVDAAGTPVARVGSSATGDADERLDVLNLPAGNYAAYVNGFASPGNTPTEFVLTTYLVGTGSDDNATVKPASVKGSPGEAVPVTVTFTGLDAGTPYLGWIGYSTSAAPTILSVG